MSPQVPREFLLGKKCSLTRLIDYTALVIKRRDESFRAAQKRVRARVRDHQSKGKIAKSEELYPTEFFAWALDFKKYDALRKLQNLPVEVRVEVSGVQADFAVPEANPVSPPTKVEDLTNEHYRLVAKNRALIEENKELKAENKELRRQMREAQNKRSETRQKLSAAGKRGGRGNES